MPIRIPPRPTTTVLSGFALGPLQNTFVDLAERDTYATNNPSWLAAYDANEFFLVSVAGTFYHRFEGAWTDASFVIQGPPGSAANLDGVPINHIPVKSSDGVNFIDSGLSVDPNTGKIITPNTIRAGVATVELGTMHGISSAGRQVVFVNRVKDIPYTPGSWSDGSQGGEWVPLTRVGGTSFTDELVQAVEDTEITNPDYAPTVPTSRRTYAFNYKASAAQTNVTVNIYLDNELVFTFGPFDMSVGENKITYSPAQDGPGFVDLESTDNYRITLTSPDGDVKVWGTAGGVPWLQLDYQEWSDKELALIEDIPTTFTSGQISDFASAVSGNAAVAANTAKVSNATHTGEVTGSTALTVQSSAISNKSLVTAANGMEVLVNDAGVLKKVNANDFLNTPVRAKAGGYTTATYSVALVNAGQMYKIPIVFTPYTLTNWQWDSGNKRFKYTGAATKEFVEIGRAHV